jgi:hypothetical protein
MLPGKQRCSDTLEILRKVLVNKKSLTRIDELEGIVHVNERKLDMTPHE